MAYLTLVALTLFAEINIVGRLLASEILLIATFLLLFWKQNSTLLRAEYRKFYIFIALWLVSQMITDIVRDTPVDDIYRGWSKIVIYAINFSAIAMLCARDTRKLMYFIAMLGIASTMKLRLDVDGSGLGADIFGSAWKFGYGQLLALLTLMGAAFLVRNPVTRALALALPFLDAALNLMLNARNLFGITSLSALLFFVTSTRKRRLPNQLIMVMASASLIFVWGLVSLYSFAADEGLLGADAKQKYEMQSSGSFGLILGGRTESLASSAAIWDSPVIGHGSWARDIKYVELRYAKLMAAGYEISGDPFASDLIPSHSHLLGAWVEAGFLGALFWIWSLWVTIRGIYTAVRYPSPRSGVIAFIGFSLCWDILFSPFGLDRRVITGAWLLLMINVTATKNRDLPLPAKNARLS